MRIEHVEARWLRFPIEAGRQHVSDFGRVSSFDALVVEIATDAGIVGWGEGKNGAGSAGVYAAMATLVNDEMGPAIIGRDPRDVAVIWDDLYSGGRAVLATRRGHPLPELSRRGITIAAISAIDLALWDILGKSLDVPVWRLLGGRKAQRMPAYGSGGWADASRIGDQLSGYVTGHGLRAVKMRVGAMDGTVRASAERIIAARAGLGPDVELMCDAHGTLTPAEAKRLCHLVRDCDLTWFEEPVNVDDGVGLAEVRAGTHIPISAGESAYTRFDFASLVERRAVDVLQPDLAVCGGLTEARRIDALAAAHGLELSPHMWAGPLAFAAGLHLAAASPVSRLIEFPLGDTPMFDHLATEPFSIADGEVAIPDGPGLGVEIRREALDRFTVAGRVGAEDRSSDDGRVHAAG